jgi:hypothetical protein
MPRGFGTRPQPWQCRLYQGHRIHTSLKIGAVDGNPITCNTAYQCVVAHRLGDSAAQALMGLAVELGDDFKVVMVSPDGHIAAEGYSQKSAARERRLVRLVGARDDIKTIQPRRAG